MNPKPIKTGWTSSRWTFLLVGLTVLAVAVQGFHPLSEDGGLYVAGVKWLLDPQLFPHDAAFVRAHLGYSIFAPVVAGCVRWLHVPVLWILLLIYIASTASMLAAGRALLRRCAFSDAAQLAGVTILAAWAAVPVAGTSLLLLDPYVTARSFSTPLCLWALVFALDCWNTQRSALFGCCTTLVVAAAFHPLMAVYGAAVVVAMRCFLAHRPWVAWSIVCAAALTTAAALQVIAKPETTAEIAAVHSRYYWFLAQWQWYEWLGLAGPLTILAIMRRQSHSHKERILLDSMIAAGVLACVVALLFAHEAYAAHPVARLQPLRIFLSVYAVMLLILGASMAEFLRKRSLSWMAVLVVIASFAGGYAVARATYAQSAQIEWPCATSRNPWVQAFMWARANTPRDALFAMDAKYVNTEGEDAQVFRAFAERSMLPDFSKDGGEAAITPSLALIWQSGAETQKGLSGLNDADRDARLAPLGVQWMVLHADAVTAHECPYRNAVVKVCSLIKKD